MWVTAGIDFGNENLVLAIPRNGGVDVIANESGSRLNPTVVCYTGDRRFFGDEALQQQTVYLDTTITQLKRLVSIPYGSREMQNIQENIPFKLVEMEDGTTGVNIKFHDRDILLRPEQCIAYCLKMIDRLAKKNEVSVNNYVIAVSPWWPERQRRALLNACKVANMNCLTLINSTTAAAVAYTMIHSKRLPEDNPAPVMFIDFGNSSMNVAVAMLKKGSVAIKSFADDDQLGGTHFTVILIKYLIEKVKQKYKIDPSSNRKAFLQFIKATEKLKKTLSINPVVQFEVLNIMDTDISFLVKREEFNTQIQCLLDRITKPIDQALEFANVKKEDLLDVEFLGGGSRVAAVNEKLTEYFGRQPKRSLNLDECFATGSAYVSALLNPSTRIDLSVKDVAPYAVEAEWSDGHIKRKELFARFSEVPSSTKLEVKVVGTTEIKLTSNGDEICIVKIETGLKTAVMVELTVKITRSSTIEVETASYKVEVQKPEEKKVETKPENEESQPQAQEPQTETSQQQTQESQPETPQQQTQESQPETPQQQTPESQPQTSEQDQESQNETPKQEQPPANENQDSQQNEEPKHVVEYIEKPAKVTVIQKVGLTEQEIEAIKKLEVEFDEADLAEEKIDITKNQLQSEYFTFLSLLRDNESLIPDEDYKNAESKTKEIMMWYDENDFDRLPIAEYESRIKILQDLKTPIKERINKLQAIKDKLPVLLKRLNTVINGSKDYPEINKEATSQLDRINEISNSIKTLPNDFTLDEIDSNLKKVEADYKTEKEQADWRAKKQQEEELMRRRKQNEEEEMRRRIQEQELQRQQLENEEEDYYDPFSLLFGRPMRRRQNLTRRQYDPEEEERRRKAEIEAERRAQQEAQLEAERRAELQRRAEEERRREQEELRRRRQNVPWGFEDDSGWGDPWGVSSRPEPIRRPQPKPQTRTTTSNGWGDPWGSSWGNSGWRDPFF